MSMVIEGILTTENADGSMHVSPIGPHVNLELTSWTLKPFQSSTTFLNLQKSSRAIFHVVDDPLLMAAAVLGLSSLGENPSSVSEILDANQILEIVAAKHDNRFGWVLDLSCRYYALSIDQWDVSAPRAIAECSLSHHRDIRPFWGWNRARHSILELSILASRVHILDRSVIDDELNRHKIIIEKTAGTREKAAWELLKERLSQ